MRPFSSTEWPAPAAAFLAGLALSGSVFVGGYHELTSWALLGLASLALVFGLAVGRPALPRGPALMALVGLLTLGVWALISTGWAESADAAWEEGARWITYAAIAGALLLLLAGSEDDPERLDRRRALIAGTTLPVLVLGGYLLARMLFGDPDSLFFNNRLNEPLGYVNGQAGFLLVGFWPLVAVAERAKPLIVQGLALAGAAGLGGLLVMAQSRGALFAFVVTAAVLLAVVPGRLRRAWVLVFVCAAIAACAGALSGVFETLPPGVGAPPQDEVRDAALAIAVLSALAGLAWGLAGWAAGLLGRGIGEGAARRISLGAICALALAGALGAMLVPSGNRVDDVRDQYEAFTELRPADSGGGRFASGGGNRYDYWRVAVDQFERHPLRGEGAGNFAADYYRDRSTTENIRQAHSIELQALGETGLVGGLALLAFVAGVGWALLARSRPGSDDFSPGLVVAGGGVFVAWLAQTSVDWLHLIPGLTGAALCGACVLLAPSMRRPSVTARHRAILAGVSGAAVLAAGLVIAAPMIAARLAEEGRSSLDTDPVRAVELARDSRELNDEALASYYLEAAALARLGGYDDARSALLEAARREPSNFVTWGLLGDLAARRADFRAAQRAYRRASALNPRDERLAVLASDRAAIRQLAAEAKRDER